MSDTFFITAAYGLTWVVLAAYALSLHRRRARAQAAAMQDDVRSGG